MYDRGYTGHEHMAGFGLINMNGRMYDPYLQRFLSPDMYVQNPSDAQNYNRYSYALNNPLMYTDPSGWNIAPSDSEGDHDEPGTYGDLISEPRNPWSNIPHIAAAKAGSYYYDGSYRNGLGETVSFEEVRTNYVLAKATFTINVSSGLKVTTRYSDVTGQGITFTDNSGGEYFFTVNSEGTYFSAVNKEGQRNLASRGGAPMIESSYGANMVNSFATLIDGVAIISELSPSPIIPRRAFNNVKASAAAGKLIAKGNVLLTWVAVGADGIDLYNNRDKATNGDYAKWGVDIGLAAAGTGLLAVATFIPGVNVVAWGVALFVVSTANTYGAFDPLYQKLNN